MTKPGEQDWESGNQAYIEGRYDQSVESYNRAIQADPNDADYRYNRGVVLFRLRQFHKALDDMHCALEVCPNDPDVRYMLGEIRSEMGERDLAIRNFKAALVREPDHLPARRAILALQADSPSEELRPAARFRIRVVLSGPRPGEQEGGPEGGRLSIPAVSDISRASSDETPVVAMERTLHTVEKESDLGDTVKRAVLLSALHRREAGPCWERVLKRAGPDENALRFAVRAYFESADWEDVCRLGVQAGNGAPEEIRRKHAQALIALGRPEEALHVVLGPADPSAETLRVLAGTYLALDKRDLALETVARARVLAPASPEVCSLAEVADGTWFSAAHPLDQLAGLEMPKAIIRERVILPLIVPELYLAGPVTNRFLMMGPPGCGKTALARVAATEVHGRLEIMHLTAILNLFTGNSEANLTALFKEAKDLAEEGPVILMVDEVDSIAVAREILNQAGERRLVTHFMRELDNIRQFPNLVVLAATNAPFEIDSAVLRSGRLGTPLYVGPPDEKARAQLIDRQLRGMVHDLVDSTAISKQLEWYSPADIEHAFASLRFRSRRLRLSGQEFKVTAGEITEEFRHISPSVRIWFHRLSARVSEDPYLETLLGGDLRSDLERFAREGKKTTDATDTKSIMFR